MPPLQPLAEKLAARLLARGQRLATAESCTGGWLAKTLTDLPGSSRWFECGYVTYSNAAKVRDLGVAGQTLERHGAVSEATALEMAAGALRRSGADIAIAVTGIAGPDGGSVEKPVGTVWLAVSFRGGAGNVSRLLQLDGDREAIRHSTVACALEWLADIQVGENSTTV